ncbi:hypothetical protein F5I97DRAFT_789770 [Phlebopus sp. FC_14]|nr:hypothetical protein F5I97DRAFT_789770 [Phlebopus sp. FC_14]
MQYNMYSHDPRAAQNSGRAQRQPSHAPTGFVQGYADHHHHHQQQQQQQQQQHHHHAVAAAPYSTLAPSMNSGVMGNPPLQSLAYSYGAPGSAVMSDDPRYFTSPSSALEHYAAPQSPTSSYASSPSPVMNPQAPRSPPQTQHFIPTPSQTYQVYSSLTPSQRPRATAEPYYIPSSTRHHQYGSQSASPPHSSSRTTMTSGSLPSHSANHTSSVASGDRYPCDLCDRSFTRLHDRRRHYETVHATSPVMHKCQYCRKDFSRADSLKRHIDNGCEERPRYQ